MCHKRVARAVYEAEVMAAISIFWTATVIAQSVHPPAPAIVPPAATAEAGPGPQTSSSLPCRILMPG